MLKASWRLTVALFFEATALFVLWVNIIAYTDQLMDLSVLILKSTYISLDLM